MMRAGILVVLMSSLGCGTMANLEGKDLAFISLPGVRKPEVYGGVRNDVRWGSLFLLETPISLVADTLTIPAVLHQRKKWQEKKEPVVADLRHDYTLCPVHNSELVEGTEPVTWGHRQQLFAPEKDQKFPFAMNDIWLSYPKNVEFAQIRYCDDCRVAKANWLKQHREYDSADWE